MRKTCKHALVCLGAGRSQVLVIHKAKALGYKVIAVDRDSQAPGFTFCDEVLLLSTYEAPPIIERLTEWRDRYEIIGVINRSSGPPVVTAAEICKALNLPGVQPDIARAVIDKSQLMALCEKHGLPAPHCTSFRRREEVGDFHLNFPCVVKPALSLVGKSGVQITKTSAEFPAAFDRAMEASMNGIVNVEQFVPGRDISLFSMVMDRQLYPIVLMDELNDTDASGTRYGKGMAVPSLFSATEEETKILSVARKIVDTLQLNNTPFFLSCRCDPGEIPRVIEIHLDMGGDLVLDALFPAGSNADVTELMIRILAGEKVTFPDIRFRPAAVLFVQGDGLVTDRPYRIFTAASRLDLQERVVAEWGKNEQSVVPGV